MEVSGPFKLPDYSTVYQAETMALKEAEKWEVLNEGRMLMALESCVALSSMDA